MTKADRDRPCRFFESGKRIPIKEKPMTDSTAKLPRYRFDQRKMQELYDRGMTDGDIAREMGCTSEAVRYFRARNQLPPHERARMIDRERMRQFYDRGLTDREIAQAMGCSVSTVQNFRLQQKLPALRKKKREDPSLRSG
jgi:DNA-directed RNA polymerase specialized sigma24 family protein